MVAIINTGHSIHNIFNYNENKVKDGVAACIGEGNYPMDVDKMNRTVKLNRLLKQASLNENVTRNSVHISLNFDPSETVLQREKLLDIAKTYMDKIGFGEQPYLIYQHYDAGHPHLHIVSIKIRHDGKRIDMQNIGRNQSETARKEIEKKYGLVVAGEKRDSEEFDVKPLEAGRIQYGKSDTRRAINRVLSAVLPNYNFTSIGELNTVLNLYNVSVVRGKEDSKMFLHKGIVYRVLDDDKKPVGVPIKASSFYNKPTLKFLETKFARGKNARLPHMKRIKNAVDLALLGTKKITLSDLEKRLQAEGIVLVLRRNTDGLLYGTTYVDHVTKSVCNGSALGKQYSAKALEERCAMGQEHEQKISHDSSKSQTANNANDKSAFEIPGKSKGNSESLIEKITGGLLQPEEPANYLPHQLKGKKKKKKRRGQSGNQ